MDKKTNIFNISIAADNFLNAVFLLVLSNAFGQPEMVSVVTGVIFALYNIAFAAVLLVLVLIASIMLLPLRTLKSDTSPCVTTGVASSSLRLL